MCSQELSCNIGITRASIHDWGLCFVGSHHLLVLFGVFGVKHCVKELCFKCLQKSNFIVLKKKFVFQNVHGNLIAFVRSAFKGLLLRTRCKIPPLF